MKIFLLIATLAIPVRAQTPATSMPGGEEIRRILVQRVDEYHQGVGIVAGMIDSNGRRIVGYGAPRKGDPRPLNGETVFEIGSITKVFTSLLLADMVQRGEVALTDPVAKYLPSDIRVPQRGGREITLQDLATHTSGLPRLPSNLQPSDPANPYAEYTVDQLYQFLSSYELTRDIGSQYEYSNLGGGLLGHVLTRRAGRDYEVLVRERITGPLEMGDTRITLSDDMKARLAQGHNARLEPVANWDLPALAGAGALRSTVNDMLDFLAANLGYSESPLAPAMASMLTVRRSAGNPGLDIALAWHIIRAPGREIIWHNGGTGGYRSFVGYDLQARTGVIVLSNTSTAGGVDDIGLHLLDSRLPLAPAPKEHVEKPVDPKLFDGYAGQYQLAPGFVLTITKENDRLFAQGTGQNKFELFAEGDREFFARVADIQIVFEVDGQGRTTSLTLVQGAATVSAMRIE